MAEQANPLEILAKKHLGFWGETGIIFVSLLLAIVAAVECTFRTAALLGESLFRWWVLVILIVLCVLGFYVESRSPKIAEDVPGGSKLKGRSDFKRGGFVIAGCVFMVFL